MRTYRSRSRTIRERWWPAVLLVLAVVLLVCAAPAAAAPPPTLGLDDLQAELTAHGSVDGFMKTGMSGTTISSIPVTVLAVVDGFSWGDLIMFECTDPAVTDIGGIAAGMSGSPIYVNVDGTDRIVGAVSYGDWFTLRGTGLATPIEYMTALQARFGTAPDRAAAVTTVRLDEPVATSHGTVRRLVLGSEKAAAAAAAGTSVVHPLAEAVITGVPSGSSAFRRLAARLEDGGLTLLAGDGRAAAGPTPDLEPGSPCGVSYASGGYALHVLGTVTYVDGDDVVMFGHPTLGGYSGYDLGLGPIEGTLVGANVDGLWPTTNTPYKMMSPADAKGVATQDRSAGVLARLGGSAPTFPVSTHATVGGVTVDDVTDLGQWFAADYWPELYDEWGASSGVTSAVAAAGLYHGLDSDPLLGSATTVTTVVVNDGTQDYTFTRSNIWDNSADYSWTGLADAAAWDVTLIMGNVLADPYDVRDIEIESVDVAAEFSGTRRYGGITDAGVPRAIRWGLNTVDVTYYRTGSAEPQSMRATLDVPAGTDLTGYLIVAPAWLWSEYYGDYSYSETGNVPLTMAQTAEIIDALPGNGDVIVAYLPDSMDEEEEDFDSGPEAAAETTLQTDWVFDGIVEKETAAVFLHARGTVDPGAPIAASGYVRGAPQDLMVDIFCQEAGDPEPAAPLLSVPVREMGSMGLFRAALPGFRHNVLLTAEVPALSKDTLPGADQVLVKVRARTRLTAARRGGGLLLTARVAPADATGVVAFQRLAGGRWVSAGSAALDHGAAQVKTRAAAKVRARFTGGPTNAASAWTTVTVR